jgi:hypothetical protein
VVMNISQNPDLTFKDKVQQIKVLGNGEWITVYSKKEEDDECTYCALIPIVDAEKTLEDPSWDLHIGHGLPGFVYRFKNGKEIASYYRFSDRGVEPLVFWRNFHGIKGDYWEVSEEFRHYFNFYEDKKNNRFLFIDDNGDEHEAIVIEKDNIKIKSKYIKEFLAVKKMRLAIFFDFNRFSTKTLSELGLKEYHLNVKRRNWCYSIGVGDCRSFYENIKSQGWLMGKKLIHGLKDFKPKLSDKENRKYEKFVIGFDKNGKEVTFTCNESKLSNFFGKNKGAPNYLTPVFFRKEVLTKYYSQPTKYSVQDGCLMCGGLWSLRMDNNHPDHVVVFLGDLGHLEHIEQLHWKHYNIPKKGKLSHTAWMRDFAAEFADPEQSDLFLKQRFADFQEKWKRKFGWYLFLPLSKDDEYHFKTLRIPLTNEQNEFDEQVLSLTKLLIDSLNEQELAKGLDLPEDSKSIDKLKTFLNSKGVKLPKMLEYLRDLQSLRSSGVAHLKGKKYSKIKKAFGIGEKELHEVFDDIIIKAIWTLNSLERIFLKDGI